MADVDLDIFDDTGSRIDATAKSDASGQYQIGPLVPGDYFVKADPGTGQGLAEQYYLNKGDINLAMTVTVIAGQDTGNVNFDLLVAGTLRGTITNTSAQPLEGIDLDLYDAATGIRLRPSVSTLTNGTYSYDGLAPGQYILRADPTIAQGFAVQYYNNRETLAEADFITVQSSAKIANVNFVLAAGGSISGTLSDSRNSSALPDVDIDIFRIDGAEFVWIDQGGTSDASGNYTLDALPAGSYVVRADPTDIPELDRTYVGDVLDATLATVLTLTAGQNRTDGDISVQLNVGEGEGEGEQKEPGASCGPGYSTLSFQGDLFLIALLLFALFWFAQRSEA